MKDLSAICVDFERFFVMLSVPDCDLETLALTMRATGVSSASAERTRTWGKITRASLSTEM